MEHTPLETADVARILEVVPDTIRQLAKAGRIPVMAVTPRGVRLFDPKVVEAFRRRRVAQAARKAAR